MSQRQPTKQWVDPPKSPPGLNSLDVWNALVGLMHTLKGDRLRGALVLDLACRHLEGEQPLDETARAEVERWCATTSSDSDTNDARKAVPRARAPPLGQKKQGGD